MRLIQKGTALVFGKGANLKTFVYVKDVVKATLCVLENENTIGETFIVKGFEVIRLLKVFHYIRFTAFATAIRLCNLTHLGMQQAKNFEDVTWLTSVKAFCDISSMNFLYCFRKRSC